VGSVLLTATGISFGTIVPAATAITRWFSRYRGRNHGGDALGVGFLPVFIVGADNSTAS